jgi:hypothetical protein
MDFKQNDSTEAKDLVKVQIKIDNIDAEYVNLISDEIFQKQPFFLTVLLGYRLDTTAIELEEIMKIYFLIWEYFRTNKKVQTIKVTEDHFETIQDKNIAMLQYADGELDDVEKTKIYSSDLGNLKSKALFTAVLYRYNERTVLLKMEERKRTIILIGIKSFIECFETI